MSNARIVSVLVTCVMLATTTSYAQPAQIGVAVEDDVNAGLGEVPPDVDRSTPRRAWASFLQLAKAQRDTDAAHLLNLKAYPAESHRERGAILARQLYRLLEKTSQLDAGALNDSPIGPLIGNKPRNYVITATFGTAEGEVNDVWLQRTKSEKTGEEAWLVTPTSLSAVPDWFSRIIEGKATHPTVDVINEGLGPIPEGFDLSTPRSAAKLFRALANDGEYKTAARILDLSDIPKDQQKKKGVRLARRLALLLHRVVPGSLDGLSNKINGKDEPGVPSNEDIVALAKTDDGEEVQLRVMRIKRTDAAPVWVFSAQTVASIDTLYTKIGYGWAGDFLPTVFFRIKFGGVQLWQAIGLLVVALLAWIVALLVTALTRRWLLWIVRRSKNEWDDALVDAAKGPMGMVYFALFYLIGSGLLVLGQGPRLIIFRLLKVICILAVGWFLVRVLDVTAELLMTFFRSRDDDVGLSMVPIARRILRPLLVALVVVLGLQNIGLNVTGLLAGLGIGGLALAMASKNTVENMLGGITIAFDRPFKVGDTITVSGVRGTVEEVGLRSTRIRTLDRTLVTIPNGGVADSNVENWSSRDRLRHVFAIGLTYETTLDQVRLVIDELKRYLYQRDDVSEGFAVRLGEFADSSMNVDVAFYIETTDWGAFTAAREEILLEVANIVARVGADFAFPTMVQFNREAGLPDDGKAKAASDLVRERTEAGTLCIPEIPEPVAKELEGGAS